MPFSVHIQQQEDCDVIQLKNSDTGCVAEIYSFGALLNRFSIPGKNGELNVIDGFESVTDAKENITNGFKSAKLSPFVCRLRNGQYNYKGENYTIDKHYLGDAAIHGLLFDCDFTETDSGSNTECAYVTLRYNYNKKNEGYPFDYNCTVLYELKADNKLIVTTTIENISADTIPVSDGWHPYFKFDQPVDGLLFEMNCDKIIVFDDGLLPTGEIKPSDIFLVQKRFGDKFLDNCFKVKDNETAWCRLSDNISGASLLISADKSYPYLQIYTPPHRTSIAIENLSSVPDAFNNQIDLIELKPTGKKAFTTSYQLL